MITQALIAATIATSPAHIVRWDRSTACRLGRITADQMVWDWTTANTWSFPDRKCVNVPAPDPWHAIKWTSHVTGDHDLSGRIRIRVDETRLGLWPDGDFHFIFLTD